MTVSKRKERNTWQYAFGYEGKTYRKSGFKTKREATEAETKARAELSEGMQFDNDVTLHDYFKEWAETYRKPNVSEITYRTYTTIIKLLDSDKIGHTPLKNITRRMYQKFITSYAEEHSNETIRKFNGNISTAVDDAVHEGIVKKNFTYKVTYKGEVEAQKEDDKYITVAEYTKLKEAVRESNARSSLILFIMIATGCRISGAIRLQYDFINKKDCTLYIDENKTDISPRTVSITPNDMQHILSVIDSYPKNMSGLVFDSITTNAVNKALKGYCQRLNIKPITSHALRHTHCSYLLSKGISIYYISKRLGHKNIKTTLEVYSHLLEESYETENDKAINALKVL